MTEQLVQVQSHLVGSHCSTHSICCILIGQVIDHLQRHSNQTHLDGAQARVVDGVRRTVVPAVPADMLRVARIPGQLRAMRSHEIAEGRPREVRDRARGQVEVGAVKVEAQQQAPGSVPAVQESTEGVLLCSIRLRSQTLVERNSTGPAGTCQQQRALCERLRRRRK